MSLAFVVVCLCFFQAEDGIRYLVRSRGLGDVYKRQEFCLLGDDHDLAVLFDGERCYDLAGLVGGLHIDAVSYTHLTLPTSDLV
mgnify:CR=1 FL=1